MIGKIHFSLYFILATMAKKGWSTTSNIRPTEGQAPSTECADGSQGETDAPGFYVEYEATPHV